MLQFCSTNGAEREGTIKPKTDSADLDVDNTGALSVSCFSKTLQDFPVPPIPYEESFTSLVQNLGVSASNTTDLVGYWDFLGADSLWWESTHLFFGAFPKSFLVKTLTEVEGALDLSGNRCTGGWDLLR